MLNYNFYKTRAHIVFNLLVSLKLSKLINLVRNQFSELFKLESAGKVPSIITLQLTYDCNLKCIMCQKSSEDQTKYNSSTDRMEFNKLMEFLGIHKHTISVLRITGGEPLRYPEFEQLIDLLNDLKIKYTILSNGTLFTSALLEKIMINCIELSFSIDSPEKETYAKIRKGGDLNKVIEAIETINRLKGKKSTPYLNASMTCFSFNLSQIPDMVKFCDQYDIPSLSVGEGMYYNTMEVEEQHFIRNHKEEIESVVNEAQFVADKLSITLRLNSPILYFAKEDNALVSMRNPKVGCSDYYNSCTITPEFDLKVCATSDEIFRLDPKVFKSFWNSPMLKLNRKKLRENVFPEECRYCIDYNANYNKQEEYSFIEYQKRTQYWKLNKTIDKVK